MQHNVYTVAALCFAVVMTGMLVLYALCLGLRGLAELVRRRGAAQREPAPAQLDPRIVVLLTAAAREALSAPVRVHAVEVVHAPGSETWSRAGRVDVMISHRMDRQR